MANPPTRNDLLRALGANNQGADVLQAETPEALARALGSAGDGTKALAGDGTWRALGGASAVDPYTLVANNTGAAAAPVGMQVNTLPELGAGDISANDSLLVQIDATGKYVQLRMSKLLAWIIANI